jgi:hypothetical protein
MTQTFILKIKLGNAAMSTPYDVARSLENTIRTLRLFPEDFKEGHQMKDSNGNTIGSWGVVDE